MRSSSLTSIALVLLLGASLGLGIILQQRNATIDQLKTQLITCKQQAICNSNNNSTFVSMTALPSDLSLVEEWVFAHSSRISKAQAKQIVSYAFQSPYPLLVLAIIEAESNFNPCAISKSGAIGLMQVLPTDYQLKQLQKAGIISNKRDLFDPQTNIKAGSYILNLKLKKAKGDISKALYYYVGGNKAYVNEVLRNLGELYLVAYSSSVKKEASNGR